MGSPKKTISTNVTVERMKPCAIGFSGRIKSGKTTIAAATADSLRWPCASFGVYVRNVAVRRRQNPRSRAVLQEIGESLVAQGWSVFCHDVLKTANWVRGMPIVIDGIRHVEAVKRLREMVSPLKFLLVYVTVDADLQLARARRANVAPQMLADIEKHSTEVDVQFRLPELADLLVDGANSIGQTVAEIEVCVQELGWGEMRKGAEDNR